MSKKVYWDKGHGGSDPGAIGNGMQEKSVVNKIVNYADKYIKANYEGVVTKMSRSGDQTRSLTQRTNEANKWGADVLVSVHLNSFNKKARGFESFVFNGSIGSGTRNLQNALHDEIMKVVRRYDKSAPDRGKKRANFHMLRESRMSAVLTENLFIDSAIDAKLLKQEAFIKAIGEAHAIGIAKHLKLKEKKKASTSKPSASKPSTGGNTVYRIITGSYKSRANAINRVAALKKAGFDSFIVVASNGFHRVITGSFANRSNANSRIAALKRAGFDSFVEVYKK